MFGGTRPALPTDAAQWVTDYNAMTFTNDCAPYRDLIISRPLYAEAMDYANLPSGARTGSLGVNGANGIWATIDLAVGAGFVAAQTVPVDLSPAGDIQRTHFTVAEAFNTYSAKVAHALWLEVTGAVPWKLDDYDLPELEELLHRDRLFIDTLPSASGWDVYGGTPFAKMTTLCDHSPKTVYDTIVAQIGTLTTRQDAISEIMFYGGSTYIHGGAPPGSRTIAEFEADGYTSGCGPCSAVMLAYARSINIAGHMYTGKFLNSGHASFALLKKKGEGYVTFHGDDVYPVTRESPSYQGFRAMADFSVWNPLVGEETDIPTADLAAGNLAGEVYTRFPSQWKTQQLTWNPWPSPSPEGWCANVGTSFQPFGPPYRSYAQQNESFVAINRHADTSLLSAKLSAANTGYGATLTPLAGPLTIDDAWIVANGTVLQNRDITGTVTVTITTSQLIISNCRIDGGGGVGVDASAATAGARVLIYLCEIHNCTNAIKGAPALVNSNHIHSSSDTCVLIDSNNLQSSLVAHYNFIDAGESTAFRVTTGSAVEVVVNGNTLVSTATDKPLVSLDGAQTGAAKFQYNWIDGGDHCFYQNRSIPGDLVINANYFGRNASSGLYLSDLGTAATWPANTYEDDGTDALIGDTAPL